MTAPDAPPPQATADKQRRRPRPNAVHARDQDASPFASILQDLVARLPGARAAALVDGEGETVDYSGATQPFEVKIAAAHWRIVLADVERSGVLGKPASIVVRGTRRSFIIHALPDAYALVILLSRRAGFAASSRAFFTCERALCREAEWALPARIAHWFPVEVSCDPRRRPTHVRVDSTAATLPVEVLGSLVGLSARERGFRVRLTSGEEMTLVREPGGCWYADDPTSLTRRPR